VSERSREAKKMFEIGIVLRKVSKKKISTAEKKQWCENWKRTHFLESL